MYCILSFFCVCFFFNQCSCQSTLPCWFSLQWLKRTKASLMYIFCYCMSQPYRLHVHYLECCWMLFIVQWNAFDRLGLCVKYGVKVFKGRQFLDFYNTVEAENQVLCTEVYSTTAYHMYSQNLSAHHVYTCLPRLVNLLSDKWGYWKYQVLFSCLKAVNVILLERWFSP